MEEQDIKCSVIEQIIKCYIKEEIIKIKVLEGARVETDTDNHSLLTRLDYDNSGHQDFQRKLQYINEYRAYEIKDN